MNTLYLIRHGENPANLTMEMSSKYVDYSLTPKGVLQAQQTGESLRGAGIDEIYSSPMKRARETAGIIAGILRLKVVVTEAFREIQSGDLEGQPVTRALWDIHDSIFFAWLKGNPDAVFPNGDNYHSLWGRMRAGLEQITAGKSGKKIAIIGHGGQFTATLKDLCPGVDMASVLRVPPGNCSVSVVELDGPPGPLKGRLVRWSDNRHLHGEAANLVKGFPVDGTFWYSPPSEI